MTNAHILQKIAELISPRHSPDTPLANAFYVTVADPNSPEGVHTCAVLQTSYSQARELIPGN